MPDNGGGGFTYFRSGAERAADTAEPKASPPAAAPASVPAQTDDYPVDGTIPDVREWVGEDLDRAQQAYDREDDRPSGPRKGVLDFLDELLAR